MNFLYDFEPSENGFKSIAERLMKGYAFSAHRNIYRLMEIEFYWHGTNHKDESTYHRRHADPDSGQWFFHYSGVDIALKNEKGYGGILIRAVEEQKDNERKLIKGPMVVAMKLFSGHDVTQPIVTRLIEYSLNSENYHVTASVRKGLGKNASESGFADKLYRFELKIN
jgi:hypothetical protein